MAKDYENDFENIDQDAEDVVTDAAQDSEQKIREAIEEVLSDDGRPVKKVSRVADDPLAESESTEDIYSGKYRRDTSDRGVYTGGTRRERMMSDTLGSEETRSARRRRRQQKRRNRRILTTLVILALLAAAGAAAYMNRGALKKTAKKVLKQETEAPTTTEAPETTAAPETEAPTTAAPTTAAPTQPAVTTNWAKDTNPDVTALVNNYYNALLEGNVNQMGAILDSTATVDEAALEAQNSYIESYDDVTTYVKDGQNPGEYAVYISYALKFMGIDTTAPGLVPAYARPNENGELRLLRYEDFDDTVKAFMGTLSQTDDVKDLAAQVNAAYTAALNSDPNLKSFVDSLAGNTQTAAAPAEGESQPAEGESQPAEGESQPAAESAAAGGVTFTETDDIRYAKTQVKCRKTPVLDNDTNDYTLVSEGTWVHVVGDSSEWCHVYLQDGTEGYIYRQYLTILPPDQW